MMFKLTALSLAACITISAGAVLAADNTDKDKIGNTRIMRTGLTLPTKEFKTRFNSDGEVIFENKSHKSQHDHRQAEFSKYVTRAEKLSDPRTGVRPGDLYGTISFNLSVLPQFQRRGDAKTVMEGLAEAVRDVLIVAGKKKGSFQLSLSAYSFDPKKRLEKLEGTVPLVTASYERSKFLFITIKNEMKDKIQYSGYIVPEQEVRNELNQFRIALSISYSEERSFDTETFDKLVQIDKTLESIRILPIAGAAPEVISAVKSLVSSALQRNITIAHESSEFMRFAYLTGQEDDGQAPHKIAGRRWKIKIKNGDGEELQAYLDIRLTTVSSQIGASDSTAANADPTHIFDQAKMTLNETSLTPIDFMKRFYDDDTKKLLTALRNPLAAQLPNDFPPVREVCNGIAGKLEAYFNHRDAVWVYWAFLAQNWSHMRGNAPAADACASLWRTQFELYGLPTEQFD